MTRNQSKNAVVGSIFIAIILYLAGCDSRLPVKYEVCDANFDDCSISARFKSIAACQEHNERSSMRCVADDQTGVMTCRPFDSPIAAGMCSK